MSLDITFFYEAKVKYDENYTHEFYDTVYSANITHNLNRMALEIGVYEYLWRGDENGIEFAAQLIPILEKAVDDAKENKSKLRQLEPSNGWGRYEDFIHFLECTLKAAKEDLHAKVEWSR